MLKKLLLFTAVTLIACSDDGVMDPGNDPSLTLSADSVAVQVGASTTLSAIVTNTTAVPMFESRNLAVATVNAAGAVTGVSVGRTVIVSSLSGNASVRDSVIVVVTAAA